MNAYPTKLIIAKLPYFNNLFRWIKNKELSIILMGDKMKKNANANKSSNAKKSCNEKSKTNANSSMNKSKQTNASANTSSNYDFE